MNEQVRVESFRDLIYLIRAWFRSHESLLREKAELQRQIEELKADPASDRSKDGPPHNISALFQARTTTRRPPERKRIQTRGDLESGEVHLSSRATYYLRGRATSKFGIVISQHVQILGGGTARILGLIPNYKRALRNAIWL